jgi:type VI secretion system protein VasG
MVEVNLKSLVARLNRTCTRALEAAAGLCISRTNYEVSPEHLLHALIDDPSADVQQIFKHFGVDAGRVQKGLIQLIESVKSGNPGRPTFSPVLLEWFQQAWLLASLEFGLAEIRSGVLLQALLASPTRLGADEYLPLLEGINRLDLKTKYATIIAGSSETSRRMGAGAADTGSTPAAGGISGPSGETALAKYANNFTGQARENKIDPVFGRDREIRQMIDILARRRKNNPICVGEPGVGKTAVVEGLALKVVEGDVPDALKNVEVMGLDMGLLQAGASVKGEFENRLKQVIEEVKASPKPIILFIDEAHTLIGAGGSAGGSDAANLLKPALARGELRTIAATTWSEYKKYFEKDAALARRFQLVKLDEPDEATTVTMLRGLRDRYEKAHGIVIRDEALTAAAQLGSRYIAGRQHPDKGVDLMDTSAARVKIALTTKPPELQDLERLVQTLEREQSALKRDVQGGAKDLDDRLGGIDKELGVAKDRIVKVTDRWQREKAAVEKVLAIRKKLEGPDAKKEGEDKLRKELEPALAALKEIQGKDPLMFAEVTPEVVARVVADWTGIPIGKMVQDQATALLTFEDSLGKRIKGQNHVAEMVGKGMRASKAGLKNPKTPMGVFLFVGPSGVGKTETALGVADLLFGGERFLTVINMSEFQEKHTVSRLIGSPPGYVGYGEGGVLTEAVRQKPYSVVLLDEVEKADPEVLNLFYQVFDKGTLSDGEGREVDFKDTVLFLTSNLATDLIMQAGAEPVKPSMDDVVTLIRPALNKHFKPALLARMTVVPFFPIGPDALKEIARLKLGQLEKRLKENHRMAMEIDPKVIDVIAERCTEVETGARNVDHIINGTLLPKISSEILQQMSTGTLPDKVRVTLNDAGDFAFQFGSK